MDKVINFKTIPLIEKQKQTNHQQQAMTSQAKPFSVRSVPGLGANIMHIKTLKMHRSLKTIQAHLDMCICSKCFKQTALQSTIL